MLKHGRASKVVVTRPASVGMLRQLIDGESLNRI